MQCGPKVGVTQRYICGERVKNDAESRMRLLASNRVIGRLPFVRRKGVGDDEFLVV